MDVSLVKTMVILAATEGLRTRPLTKYLPKVLLPIRNKPMIIHHLERAEKVGVDKAIITLDKRLGNMIQLSIEKGYEGKLDINFIYQKERTGLGYAVLLCKDFLQDLNFLIYLADEYNETDNAFRIIRERQYNDCDGIIGILKCDSIKKICSTASILIDEETGEVKKFVEKPSVKEILSEWIFSGSAIFDERFLNILAEEQKDYSKKDRGEFSLGFSFQRMIERGFKIGFVKETGRHLNLTEIEDFWSYNFIIQNRASG